MAADSRLSRILFASNAVGNEALANFSTGCNVRLWSIRTRCCAPVGKARVKRSVSQSAFRSDPQNIQSGKASLIERGGTAVTVVLEDGRGEGRGWT